MVQLLTMKIASKCVYGTIIRPEIKEFEAAIQLCVCFFFCLRLPYYSMYA